MGVFGQIYRGRRYRKQGRLLIALVAAGLLASCDMADGKNGEAVGRFSEAAAAGGAEPSGGLLQFGERSGDEGIIPLLWADDEDFSSSVKGRVSRISDVGFANGDFYLVGEVDSYAVVLKNFSPLQADRLSQMKVCEGRHFCLLADQSVIAGGFLLPHQADEGNDFYYLHNETLCKWEANGALGTVSYFYFSKTGALTVVLHRREGDSWVSFPDCSFSSTGVYLIGALFEEGRRVAWGGEYICGEKKGLKGVVWKGDEDFPYSLGEGESGTIVDWKEIGGAEYALEVLLCDAGGRRIVEGGRLYDARIRVYENQRQRLSFPSDLSKNRLPAFAVAGKELFTVGTRRKGNAGSAVDLHGHCLPVLKAGDCCFGVIEMTECQRKRLRKAAAARQ